VRRARRTVAAGTRRALLAACALLALTTAAALAARVLPSEPAGDAAADAPRDPLAPRAPEPDEAHAARLASTAAAPARFEGTPERAVQPLLAADIRSDVATCAGASTARSGRTRRCGGCGTSSAASSLCEDELPADARHVSAMVVRQFWTELNDAGSPLELRDEVTEVLVQAARGLDAGMPAGAGLAEGSVPDIARLRRHVPDSVVRQLIRALPPLIRQRELAPIVEVQPQTGSSARSHAGSPVSTILVAYPLVRADGSLTADWILMSGENDPRLAAARREAEAATREFQRSVEAVLGLRLAGEVPSTLRRVDRGKLPGR
jgi:hypothetical protein